MTGPVVVTVDDADDPRLADYRSLTDVALRTRTEPAGGLFIAESELVIRRALATGHRPRSVLVSPRWLDSTLDALDGIETTVYAGEEQLLRSVTGFPVHRGALAAMHRKPLRAPRDVTDGARRVLVAEDVVNHTNLGAMVRSAAALGVDGMVISPSCADPLYRRSVRVSMGAVLSFPWARAQSWPGELERLQADGFQVVALTPAPDATPLEEVEVGPDDRIALLLGTEGPGLSAVAARVATRRVRIPMTGEIDSLNVAAATALACWALRTPNGPRGGVPARPGG